MHEFSLHVEPGDEILSAMTHIHSMMAVHAA